MFSSRDSLPGDALYSNVQRVLVRNGFEERPRDLRITVDSTSNFSKSAHNVLQIQILDDDDPFFFYSLNLAETDYLRLKSSQGLLVDFCSFPSQVVRLLEQCKDHEGGAAKFLLILEDEGRGECAKTVVKIVETNNFKHLCHLVLQIDRGNDEDVKKIMIRKIKSLKEQNTKAENAIMSLESQLSSKNLMVEAAERRAAEFEDRWKADKLAYQAQAAKGLTEETDKFRKAQLDWQIKAQREKAEIEERFHAIVREKDADVAKLRIENQIVSDKRSQAEATLAEQSKRVEVLEKELMAVRTDLAASRKNLARSEAELHDKERSLSNIKNKLSANEHEMKEKSMLLTRQEEVIKNLQEHKARLEGTISEKEAYIAKKQKTIQNVSEELIKANEIIAKLQKELSSLGGKLKTRTDIALEQEKVIERHVKVIERLEKELKVKAKKLSTLDSSEEGLKTKLNELQETLEAKDKKIKENEKIIDWLNRRCTEQAVQSYTPSYGMLSSGDPGRPVAPLVGNLGNSGVGNLGNSGVGNLGNSGVGNPSGFKTSTPLERVKDARVPFATMSTPPSRFNILALDKMETPAIQEESETDDASPKGSPKPPPKSPNLPSDSHQEQTDPKPVNTDKKRASPVDPPKISSKPTRKPPVTVKKNQPPTVPSSYFFS